jgi:hypothetical protein
MYTFKLTTFIIENTITDITVKREKSTVIHLQFFNLIINLLNPHSI